MVLHKKISVIMPVYNTGEYFRECIESILMQTYSFWELICVDDCSTDSLTKQYLEYFEQADERIKVIRLKKNAGAAEARNIGFSFAKGDYVLFLDSDDTFESVFFESMVSGIDSVKADICVCGHRVCNGNTEKKEYYPKEIKGVTDRSFKIDELGEEGLAFWWDVPWNKIYSRSFLKSKDIKFQSLKSYNDGYFACSSIICAEQIVYLKDKHPLINYMTEREGQISNKRNNTDSYFFLEKLLNDYWDKVNNNGKVQLLFRLVNDNIGLIKKMQDKKEAYEMYELVKKMICRLYNKELEQYLSKKLLFMCRCWKEKGFDEAWFNILGDYYSQLIKNKNYLMEITRKYDNVVTWGDGKRGRALQKLLVEEDVFLDVIDKNAITPYVNIYGHRVESTMQKKPNQLIIATNSHIYNEMSTNLNEYTSIIDLEEYCPID